MCGISGILHADGERPVSRQALESMTQALTHRGPDDEGYFLDGNVGLGFRRLSIIDLVTGHQPLANEDDTIWIVYNGEVYNFPELREQLVSRGHTFRTQTDTEVIVHLYEEYGDACVEHLRGMFAFAIWDQRTRSLFCARDRFGIKPFFYLLDGDRFVFASEIKAILGAGLRDRTLDVDALDDYFANRYIGGERTIYRKVRKLLPGHCMRISMRDGRLEVSRERYWGIHFDADHSRSEESWCEALEAELSASVKMRMISDVPLGAFLSGGIDSSAVVAMMAQHAPQPIKTFSIGFRESAFNELPYAREVASRYGTDHHEMIVEPDSIELLGTLVHAYDEPFADASAIPAYHVSRFAREHVTVVLSGDGGDELFAGYNRYPKFRRIQRLNRMPHAFNRRFWGRVHGALPDGVKGKGLSHYLSLPAHAVPAHMAVWTQAERRKLYQPDFWSSVSTAPAEVHAEALIENVDADEPLSAMLGLDLQTFLVDDILTKVDRASMLNSLETRVPILDHKLAELSFRIPSHLKLRGKEGKYIFKRSLSGRLPESTLNHRKQGFSVPLGAWFKESLHAYARDRLCSSRTGLNDYVNPECIPELMRQHASGSRDLSGKIWSLLVLDTWLEHHGAA